MPKTPVVDMRNRPSFLHPFFGGGAPGTPEYGVATWLNGRVGSRDLEHFARSKTPEAYVAEIEAAGIDVAVMVARSVPGVRISNDELAGLAKGSGGRLIGVASVDPVELGRDAAVAEAERAIGTLGLRGLNLDAGFYATGLRADDDRLLPLYEVCQKLGVPAFVMSGPTTPDLRLNDPFAIDRVAKMFPKLPIVCCHGFYPHVREIVTVAFRNENVFVSPDMYVFCPGGALYVEAANHFMGDQLLFGSSYPFRPMRQGVEDFAQLGLGEEAHEKALWKNADRLLGLGLAAARAA